MQAGNLKAICRVQNGMKAPHRYVVQGSDTTMLPIAASLFKQIKQ